MASDSHPLDEIVTRPGVYFNPQTEVLIVVDDSAELDGEIFNMEDFEGADWVTVSDEVPVDEDRRDELLVAFQTHYHPGDAAQRQPHGERAGRRRRRRARRPGGRPGGLEPFAARGAPLASRYANANASARIT